jgi:hypothetical protein
MNKKRAVFFVITLWLAIVNCNLPGGQNIQDPSPTPPVDLAGTITAMAALPLATAATGAAPSETGTQATVTSSPTPCVPNVVANSPVNVRSGPGTDYEPPIGSLPQGGSAGVAGKSDDGTWWYIEFPAGSGGHGWISGSVVTAYCIPSTLASVAAPPLPTAKPTKEPDPPEATEDTSPPPVAGAPDLVATGMMVHPNPATKGVPIDVRVGVKNQGNAAAGSFSVEWWSSSGKVGCNWTVASLAPGESIDLDCTYTYTSWSTYTIKEVIDPANSVTESNEGNNSRQASLVVKSSP